MNGRLAGLFCGVAFGALVLSQTSQAADFTVHAGEVINGTAHLTSPGYVMAIEKDAVVNGPYYAIVEHSSDNKVVNAGTINGTVAIFSVGPRGVVENSGTINGRNSNGMGIQSLGADAKIINSGTIQADDGYAEGINSSGANLTVDNSGTIQANGEQSTGILFTGGNAKVTNTGLVRNTGDSGTGIFAGGNNAYVENGGRVLSTGYRSTGVKLFRRQRDLPQQQPRQRLGLRQLRRPLPRRQRLDRQSRAPSRRRTKPASASIPSATTPSS